VFVPATRGVLSFDSAQRVEVMQLLYRRHPKVRMEVELVIKPGGSTFLSSHTQKIRTCITGGRSMVSPIEFIAHAGFEWPG
jgi:hypothetical protein